MASKIKVRIAYDDGSKAFEQTFNAADTDPSSDVIKNCETTALNKWEEMGGSIRGLKIDVKVVPS